MWKKNILKIKYTEISTHISIIGNTEAHAHIEEYCTTIKICLHLESLKLVRKA